MKARHPVARHLQQLRSDNFAPHALPLRDRSGPLYCDQLLRLTPGQRASFHGRYAEQEVLIKVWFGAKHLQACQREVQGLQALTHAGCQTPAVIHAGVTSDQAATVLVLRWLPEAENLSARWPRLRSDGARRELLLQLADQVAAVHLAGYRQQDLHFASFLWWQQQLIALDGDEVVIGEGALAAGVGLDNLAQLFAQLPPLHDGLIHAAYARYSARRFGRLVELWPAFLARIQRRRLQRLADVLEKTRGSAHWLRPIKAGDRTIVASRRWLSAELEQALLHTADGANLPAAGLQTLASTPAGGLAALFGTDESAALQRFRLAHALQLFDIDTPEPVAAISLSGGAGKGRSLYICRQSAAQPLDNWLDAAVDDASRQAALGAELCALLSQLHALRLTPGADLLSRLRLAGERLQISDPLGLGVAAGAGPHRRRFARELSAITAQLARWPALQTQVLDVARKAQWLR